MNPALLRLPKTEAERAADAAFEAYRVVLARHAAEPDRWDDPDRVNERSAAYQHFNDLFEGLL